MSPVAELERALDERHQMEESLRKRKAKMESRLTEAMAKMKRLHAEKLAAAEKARELAGKGEISEKEAREIQKLEQKIDSLNDARARFEAETVQLHEALETLGPACEPVSGSSVFRDLLLGALDDDAGNELYAEGARRYAGRLADRIRDGEFDRV